jgi:Raf kinase inhibitor-like YbhB/YbcL family protein
MKTLEITSPAFVNEGYIPKKYTCEGDDISPPINVKNLPNGTKSLALIVEDPDTARGTLTHWTVYNIDPGMYIRENSVPGTQAVSDLNRTGYGGPCPPTGMHRYFFKVFALDRKLSLPEGTSRKELELAMGGHVLGKGELMGRYAKTGM